MYICSRNTCGSTGNSTCPIPKPASAGKDIIGAVLDVTSPVLAVAGPGPDLKVAPNRRTQPAAGRWSDPINYGSNRHQFIRGETYLAMENAATKVDISTSWTTFNHIVFGAQPETLGVAGLFGCASAFVISRRGAWMSHFWEQDFDGTDPDGDYFREHVLDALTTGVGNEPPIPFLNWAPLGELHNNDENGYLGHLFDDDSNPQVFVAYPRMRIMLPDGTFSNDENAGSDQVMQWPDHVQKIVERLHDIFPTVMIRGLAYSPMVNAGATDPEFDTHRGKILIQYQPAHDCDDPPHARWRIFAHGRCKSCRVN